MRKAFTWRNVTFYGSPAGEIGSVDYVLALNERGASFFPVINYTNIPRSLLRRLPKIKQPRIIHVPVPDFRPPQIDLWIFKRIILTLSQRHKKVSICVCCDGGKGRTGTILAGLAHSLGVCKGDPVAFIRRVYDRDAVETEGQIEWLSQQLGIEIKSKPPMRKAVGGVVFDSRGVGTTQVFVGGGQATRQPDPWRKVKPDSSRRNQGNLTDDDIDW